MNVTRVAPKRAVPSTKPESKPVPHDTFVRTDSGHTQAKDELLDGSDEEADLEDVLNEHGISLSDLSSNIATPRTLREQLQHH